MKTKFKHISIIILFLHLTVVVNAQTLKDEQQLYQLPEINLKEEVSLHFISPEPIQYVDLSTSNLTGDLPTQQISRIKLINLMKKNPKRPWFKGDFLGVITVVGQSFMAQYKVVYNPDGVTSNVHIRAEDMQPLENSNMKLSSFELNKICNEIKKQRIKNHIRRVRKLRLEMKMNNVYVTDDYIFIDLSVLNKTNLSYNIDDIKFSIEDKRIYKATNNQSLYLKPVFSYNKSKSFRYRYRNIFVFKKFTFPNSKILKIRLIENQISGRTIEMKVKYSDVLNADTI